MNLFCNICNDFCGRSYYYHLKYAHQDEFGELDEQQMKELYYFKYYMPNENKLCPYCSTKIRHVVRYTRCKVTCASPECISEYSRVGAYSQIKQAGGVEAWHRNLIDNKIDHGDTGAGLRAANHYRLEYYNSTGYRTEPEKILAERLQSEGIEYNYQDHRFHSSHCYFDDGTQSCEVNFIPDFIIGNLVIEIDGWYHEGRENEDNKRDNYCLNNNYKVLRVSNEFIYNKLDLVIDRIKSMMTSTTIERVILK